MGCVSLLQVIWSVVRLLHSTALKSSDFRNPSLILYSSLHEDVVAPLYIRSNVFLSFWREGGNAIFPSSQCGRIKALTIKWELLMPKLQNAYSMSSEDGLLEKTFLLQSNTLDHNEL